MSFEATVDDTRRRSDDARRTITKAHHEPKAQVILKVRLLSGKVLDLL